jgi:hypothetical protein
LLCSLQLLLSIVIFSSHFLFLIPFVLFCLQADSHVREEYACTYARTFFCPISWASFWRSRQHTTITVPHTEDNAGMCKRGSTVESSRSSHHHQHHHACISVSQRKSRPVGKCAERQVGKKAWGFLVGRGSGQGLLGSGEGKTGLPNGY